MLLDMTFRCEIPDEEFFKMQQTIAECANQVQRDRVLAVQIIIPHDDGSDVEELTGYLIDTKQSF